MAFSATLTTEGETLALREYHWGIVQPTDPVSRPQSGVLTGKISLVLDRLSHPLFDGWMADARKRLSGTVVAAAPNGMGASRRLRFVDALCVNQGLQFTDDGSGRLAGSMSLLLTARELHVEELLTIDNRWPQ